MVSTKKKIQVPEVKFQWKDWFYLPVFLITVGAFLLRVLPQLNKVFVNGIVLFNDPDSYYHMRLADVVYANFPKFLTFDSYLTYPGGSSVGFRPLWGWIIGATAKIFGLNIDIVGAWLAPIVSVGVLLLVYFIGRELFNRWVGLTAVFLVGVLPTEFLHRSRLGNADHHTFEVFSILGILLFLFLARKYKRWYLALVSGVFLGLGLWTWHGGLLFVAILGVWYVVEGLIKHFRRESTFGISRDFFLVVLTGCTIILPYYIMVPSPKVYLTAFLGALVLPVALYSLTLLIRNRYLFLSILSISGLLAFLLIDANTRAFIDSSLRAVFWGFGSPVDEMIPSTPTVIFVTLGISIFLAIGGFYYAIKKKVSILFIVWCVISTLLIIGQRRWGYYFVVTDALLAGLFLSEISRFLKEDSRGAAFVIILLFLVLPSIRGIGGVVSLTPSATLDWVDTCNWIRENTLEQFDNPNQYYSLIPEDPKYVILSWWDYGHYITRIAHRVPTSNPANWGAPGAYRFLTAQTVEEAEGHIKDLPVKYVIVDLSLISPNIAWVSPTEYAPLVPLGYTHPQASGKFPAVCLTVGLEGNWEQYLVNSMAYKLYTSYVPGYNLVFEKYSIKIFEKVR